MGRDDGRETIKEHVDLVVDYSGGWPDDPPEDVGGENFADALAAWSFARQRHSYTRQSSGRVAKKVIPAVLDWGDEEKIWVLVKTNEDLGRPAERTQ